MRNVALSMAVLLAAGACKQAGEAPSPAATSRAEAPAAPAAQAAPAARAVARTVKEENDLYEFEYAYPAPAAAIPALKAWLDADLETRRAEVARSAREDRKAATSGGYPFRPHSASTDWQVVADIPGWLSLSQTVGSYTGGAHPNHGFGALLWDRAANRRREAADLFRSKAALSEAIRAPFCDALDTQRAKKRGEAIDRDSGDPFDECIDPAESTIILGSSNRRTFDRIGVLVSPYAAGPYAEGNYEVTLPLTPALKAAIDARFRAAFAP